MKNVLILHGTGGNSKENWFPWLKNELLKKGYKVWLPDLPGANKPDIPRYNQFIFSKWQFDHDSILIGHSSGAVAILGLLQKLPKDTVIEKAILVAGFKDDLNWEELKMLFKKPFNWEKIKKQAKEFILIHSDNDPYVDLEHGKFLKEKLRGKLVILPGRGHFGISSMGEKYKQFPELLKYI